MMSRAALSFALLASLLVYGCGQQNYDYVGKTSMVTGKKYNDKDSVEYARNYVEQEPAPNLVFIEGGTFHMGNAEKDIAYRRNARERQVSVSSFYMDRSEIANVHWKEFLHFVENEGGRSYVAEGQDTSSYYSKIAGDMKKLLRALYPDTTVWFRDLAYNDPYIQYYYSHHGFNMYPVVGVTWYQAQEFCKWRTYVVNQKLKEENPEAIVYPRYRLPTEAEWEYAARGLHEQQVYPWRGKSLRNLEGRFRANFKRGRGDYAGRSNKGASELFGGLNDAYNIPAPIIAEFAPNDFGLYHMAGNVAEWTLDTYRSMAYEDVEDLNPYRRRGQTRDPWEEDASDYYSDETSLLYNPADLGNEPSGRVGEGPLGKSRSDYDRVKVYRGGSWDDVAYYLSAGTRRFYNADSAKATIGFRCAMTRVGSPRGSN